VLLATCVAAQAGQPAAPSAMLRALQTHDWASAATIAAGNQDGLAARLVTFIRLLQPGQAQAAELDAFIKENPGWPNQSALLKRLGEALALEPDGAVVRRICASRELDAVPALLHCAELAEQGSGETYARRAWVLGIVDIAGQTDFLRRWGDAITPDDDWRRFQRLAAIDDPAATAQEARLDPQHGAAAQARLALRHDDGQAEILLERVPAPLRADPTLVLEHLRFLRRNGANQAAAALWRGAGLAAEAAAEPAARAAFWTERESLARALLAAGDARIAREIATDSAASGDRLLETQFLSGWISLRRLGVAAASRAAFQAMTSAAGSAISRSRAWYWLARASEAAGQVASAQTEYETASGYVTTFYGQRAAAALGREISIGNDPDWTVSQAADFNGSEMVRAARILCDWGDLARAKGFLLRFALDAHAPGAFAWVAQLAADLRLTDTAVQIARLAGRQGVMLPRSGWPVAFQPPAGHAALVLGIIRQESSFDPLAVSPAGAVGLMQIRPATGAETARRLGTGADLRDPLINMRLGTAYLGGLLTAFDGQVPYALAAYNAGPHRVRIWQGEMPVPRDEAGMIDWIEMIPYAETRNYVQRVIEGATIYARKAGARFDALASQLGVP
jgi:soluble lytic murein transglycosylase